MIRVLAVSSYPVEAAATRFRIQQFERPLAERGIEVDLWPFLTGEQFRSLYRQGGSAGKILGMAASAAKRVAGIASASKYDLLFVQREAVPFGPAIFERLYQSVGRMPMVLDLDDATYVRYVSPTYGRLGSALKFFGKTDKLIDRSAIVIAGNRYIAEYAEGRGTKAAVIPTIVDTSIFCPAERANEIPVIGWIGTHSTFQFLKPLFPVLQRLAEKYPFRLKVVGAGTEKIKVDGLEIEALEWSIEREVEDFRSIDIGLYPLETKGSLDPAWLAGKSGFKAIQYMSVGIPFVMSPVGVCSEMGVAGKTHVLASAPDMWSEALEMLIASPQLRHQMGNAGRNHALQHYSLETQADKLAENFRTVLA